ncbi:MAG: ATP-dependent protease ATPase subunit HslU [Thermomicrobiales bacterium]|nr:ATP-dependent protease ATPase subunit HslU [Thermomicrobiales bacterium]MCO5222552.1 ATP-dependent protease ATPase subunit HslU [Thermomicrobiales bacterium]
MAEAARHVDKAAAHTRSGGERSDDVLVENLTPAAIVRELDLHIIGQNDAKRAVAVALRNRYRRRLLPESLRDEIHPRNILMIGPTGVGKTEIARRVAKMVDAPFLKVEATKFTEVGYVGRDVESIVRDLVEVAISNLHNKRMDEVRERASQLAEERLVDLVTEQMLRRKPIRNGNRRLDEAVTDEERAARQTLTEQRRVQRERKRMLRLLQEHALDEETIEIEIDYDEFDEFVPGEFGDEFADELQGSFRDFLDTFMPRRPTRRKVSVREAERILTQQEAYRMVDAGSVIDDAILRVEESGVIFLDEIDKTISSGSDYGGDVSGEGVQRDLLPIVEGSVVMTRYGPVKTDHILFIAAGSFHDSRPSDLIPELQGRFPIRVELGSLDEDDLYRILTEPRNALTRQYEALLATEDVTLEFTDASLREMARLATLVNSRTEDIGARRLQTIFERVLEEISFAASDRSGERILIEDVFVTERVGEIAIDEDLSNFIL